MYKRSLGARRNVRGVLSSQNSSIALSRNVEKPKTSTSANDENDIFNKLGLSSHEDTSSSTDTFKAPENGSKSQSKKKPANYFEKVICSSGLINDESQDAFQLSKDQALFVKELECELKSHLTYPKNVDEFISDFEKHISSLGNLRKALAQTKTSNTCTTARSMQQDSLVRLLLLTAELQSRISKLMLEKVAEFAFSSVDDMSDDENEVTWVRLILSQFRLLDFVVDGNALATQLIDIMQVAPESVQQEVIFFMPQIISDDKHQDAAESLSKMLRENFALTPIILDVLSQLNIGSALRAQVCEEMLDALRKAPLEFLPSIVAFILSEAESSDLKQVIPRLRLVLDLTASPTSKKRSADAASQSTQSGSSKNRSTSQSSFEVLILEAISMRLKVGSQGQKLFDAWLSSLEAVKSAADHRPLDLLIIIILLDSVSGVQDGPKERTYRRKVDALLKSKVRSSLFTEDLLTKTFSQHPSALQEHLKAVTAIASLLLSSREIILLNHGAAWLRLSFVHLAEYLRVTILGEIIMHAAIGKVETVNVMLQTLRTLAHDHYEKLAPRSALLMGLLEKVEDMDVEQVRQLMDVLCFLAFSKDEHGSRLRSDITILMRKHLSSSNTQLKRKGVISATMVVKHMASLESESQGSIEGASHLRASSCSKDSQASDDSLVPGSKAFNAMIYIEMVLTTCSCYPEVFGLLFDQLSSMAMDAELDEKFMEWIVKTMSLDLQNSFLVESSSDFESYSTSFEDLPVMILYGLDQDINNHIALNLTPLVAQREERLGGPRVSFGGKSSERAELPLEMLNPALRLMRILRFRLENGDLSSIDALLGCGVVLPKLLMGENDGSKIVEEFSALSIMEQKTLLSSMMYAINWFRELVNAFAFQKDQELRIKVIRRVMNIVELQEILIECLPHLPGYAPPPAHFLSPTTAPPSFGSMGKSKGPKKKKAKKSKKGIQLTGAAGTQGAAEEEDDDEEEVDECGGEKGGGKEYKGELILSALSPFFRELDMEVFGVLLSEDLVLNPPKNERPAELGPAELLFLLEDYTLKLEHALSSSPQITISTFAVGNQARAMPFSSSSKKKNAFIFYNLDVHETKIIVRSIVSLLPYLCKKLETISEYFQDTIQDFDGVLDNPQMFLGHAPVLARCLQLLLRDIGALLSWNGYSSLGAQGTSFMKEILSIIGVRAAEGATQRTRSAMSINQLAQECCSYFGRFAEWIVRLPTAVALVSLLHQSTALTDAQETQREQLVSVCRMFLSREWIGTDGLPETGTGAAVNLGLIMTSFLWGSCSGATGEDSPLATLNGIIEEVEKAAENMKSAKDRLSAFPSVTKSTFHVVYQALATWLVSVVKEEEIEVVARSRQRGADGRQATQASQSLFSQPAVTSEPSMDKNLDWWQLAVKSLLSLVKISKTQDSRRNLSTLLKKSLLFINLFLSNGMPVLDKALCSHPNKVYALLRELQNSTRFLQHLCCDCKVKGDVGLTTNVPPMKRSLEQLVFRVKDMLLKNNCAVAFWVGNLKNKNLRGEEIVSQHVSQDISLNSDEGSAEEEDENADSDSSMPTRKTPRGKRKIVSDDDDDDSEVGSDLD